MSEAKKDFTLGDERTQQALVLYLLQLAPFFVHLAAVFVTLTFELPNSVVHHLGKPVGYRKGKIGDQQEVEAPSSGDAEDVKDGKT